MYSLTSNRSASILYYQHPNSGPAAATTLGEVLYRPLNFNIRSDWDCKHLICYTLLLHPLLKALLPLIDTHIFGLERLICNRTETPCALRCMLMLKPKMGL